MMMMMMMMIKILQQTALVVALCRTDRGSSTTTTMAGKHNVRERKKERTELKMAKKRKQQNQHQQQSPQLLVVVLPGDDVTRHVAQQQHHGEDGDASGEEEEEAAAGGTSPTAAKMPKIGTGLRYDAVTGRVYATVAGRLERRPRRSPPVYFVRENLRRYIPSVEDRVVGIVEDRVGSDGAGGDVYRINIGASHPATLSSLSFEGATKRNRPSFKPGQLLYARISDLNSSLLDPVLSCQLGPHDAGIPRRDWMTGEGCYGELKGGTAIRVSTGLARQLLKPDNVVLSELSNLKLAFEVAVGANGLVWVHSTLPDYTVAIVNAIQNSSVLTEAQTRAMVKSLVYTVKKQIQQQFDAMEE